MSSSSLEFRRKLYLNRYLDELEAVTGRDVTPEELSSVEKVSTLRELAKLKSEVSPAVRYEIVFSDEDSEQFRAFLRRLNHANPSPVYIWTAHTIDCGILLVPSIEAVKLDFKFFFKDEGNVVLATSDHDDRALIDFSEEQTGQRTLTIEIRGPNWTKVTY